MRNLLLAAALGTAAVIATPASAAITFNLDNVTLTGGGSLSGWFTTSDDLNTLIDFSVTSTSNTSAYGVFTGRTYTKASAANVAWVLPTGLWSIYVSPNSELTIYFQSGLTAAGGTLAGTTSERQPGTYSRYAATGSAIAAPEPASWALMIGGFALVGGAIRSRKVRFTAA